MFENNLIAGVSGQGGGYSIEDSLRFNDNDSAYLSRTPSVAGNRKTWTWSAWVKRGNVGSSLRHVMFDGYNSSAGHVLSFYQDTLTFYSFGGASSINLLTTSLYRDPSGWYHIVLSVDTTQGIGSDRVKIYVNGDQVTSFTAETYPSQNAETYINNNVLHNIGRRGSNQYYFDGYMAETNFIDGQQLTPDDFGQIDETTGEWSPKRYAGAYGTNGFYLPFDGNANDDSGNGNNWTENNLASTDYMIDTPTNNFAVLNAVGGGISETLSEGNLSVTTPNTGNTTATIGVTSGKWYWEGRLKNDNYYSVGLTNEAGAASTVSMSASGSNSVGYWSGGGIYDESGLVATVASYGTADVVASALDMDSGNIKFYKNNSLIYTYTFGSSGAGTTFPVALPAVNCGGFTGRATDTNFGQDSSFAGNKTRQGNTDANGIGDFYYTPPTGYLALCTGNLPAPAIEQPETQFNVVTYNGNSSSNDVAVGFDPDFVWIKRRTGTGSNSLYDTVRGDYRVLWTDYPYTEVYNTNQVSFIPGGFNIAASSLALNNSGDSYVAWCWKAGGTAVTNTDGNITAQVSANVDAGFSIATYTGINAYGTTATIGHGLDKKPELVIIIRRDGNDGAIVGGPLLGNNYYFYMNSTSERVYYLDGSGGSFFNLSGWSDSVVNVYNGPSTAVNTGTYVMYSFHSVEGFSKFGSYTGNGSADGPFVYTGFKPAFIMYKRAIGGTANWVIADNMREGYNGDNPSLYPNLSNIESSASSLDILSNGFKINSTGIGHNASGSTYIYMAFAEHPTKFSLGR